MPNHQTAPPRRRWFQFGLRSLLVSVTLLGAFLGWLAWEWRIVRERQAARHAIIAEGGAVISVSDFNRALVASGQKPPQWADPISFWRRWLGDEAIITVALTHGTEQERTDLRRLFPDAHEIVMPAEMAERRNVQKHQFDPSEPLLHPPATLSGAATHNRNAE